MKLYKTTCIDANDEHYFEFASSDGNASKIRTRLKKLGMRKVSTEEVEVETTRTELIHFLNKLGAHESWIPDAVAEALK